MKTIESIEYCEGYRKALMDLHVSLSKWGPAFRADRKRNNVKNVVWLLECLLNSPDTFAAYGPETPIYFREAGKRLNYYIGEEWPVVNASPDKFEKTKETVQRKNNAN